VPGMKLLRFCRVGAILFLLLASSYASAQYDASKAAHPSLAPVDDNHRQVVVNNRLITVMRGTLLGYSPEERAAGAERRLRDILANDGPGEIAVQSGPEGYGFSVDGALAFFVTPDDADTA